jgi:hypothetical protein
MNLNIIWLSDLLNCENAQIAHVNEKSLNKPMKESKEEKRQMRILSVSEDHETHLILQLIGKRSVALRMPRVFKFSWSE